MENLDFVINEMIAALEAMDPEILTGGILFWAGAIAAIAACVAIRQAFIPVFNTYNNYKIAWNGKLFFLYAALTTASTILGVYTEGFLAMAANVVSLGAIYMAFKQHTNMAKAFGKGNGTGIALILFPGITTLILGLGKAEFQGKIKENN